MTPEQAPLPRLLIVDDDIATITAVIAGILHRGTDLAARYGGEEFACLLPDTHPAEGVQDVAARICQRVADLNIPHGHSPTASHVTVSLGCISATCHHGATPSQFVALADEQLYLAKAGGRNRVCFRREETKPD